MADSIENSTKKLEALRRSALMASEALDRANDALGRMIQNQVVNPSQAGISNITEEMRLIIGLTEAKIAAEKRYQQLLRSSAAASDPRKRIATSLEQKRHQNQEEIRRLRGSATGTGGEAYDIPAGAQTRISQLTAAIERLNAAEQRLYNTRAQARNQSGGGTSDRGSNYYRAHGGATKEPASGEGPQQQSSSGGFWYNEQRAAMRDSYRYEGTGTFSQLSQVVRAADAQGAQKFKKHLIDATRSLQKTGFSLEQVKSLELPAENIAKMSTVLSHRVKGKTLTKNYQMFVDDMGNIGQSFDELRRIRLSKAPELRKAHEFAKRYGFQPTDIKDVKAEGHGLYRDARYERVDQYGVKQGHNVRIDPMGNVSSAPVRRQYQTFAQGAMRDVGELMKWSIAIAAIYGPINAASEAISELIENQSKLASVSIALNAEVADTDDVFKDVYASAKFAGETVTGVIDAFGQAYTAAGRVSNEFQRYNVAVDLLNDSLLLSKLSTLDEAGAIDVLTAALYQTAPAGDTAAEALTRGSQIIDQWIRVSKIASVDVETLATGVAVLGDSAETAGLSLEQLNALMATISETSLAAGKEAANIAKALIGNYQQESAVKELNRLGIAVTDVTGKTRQFLDVMTDVAAMREAGLIGDEDFSRLTLALGGGGIRRQKDVSAFIENFGRMQQIAGMQEGTEGEASSALERKLDTVETATTRLDNAMSSLAQTMGTEGGLLDSFTTLLNATTKIIETLDFFMAKFGRVGPMLTTVLAGALLFRGKDLTATLANNALIPAAGWLGASDPKVAGYATSALLTGQMNPIEAIRRASYERQMRGYGQSARDLMPYQPGKFGQGNLLGRMTSLPTVGAIALPAIQNFAQGDTEEGVASIAGGILGALATGGSPIGALIGSAIANAFVSTTMTYETQFADFFAGTFTQSAGAEVGVDGLTKKSTEELQQDLFREMGFGQEWLGQYVAFMGKLTTNLPGWIGTALTRAVGEEGSGFRTEEAAALNWIKRNNPEMYDAYVARYGAEGGKLPDTETYLSRRARDLSQESGTMPYLQGLQSSAMSDLQQQLITGDIKPADYANRMANLSAFSTTAPRYMAALEDSSGRLPEQFTDAQDAYQAFLTIVGSGNQEIINQLNQQIEAIQYYQTQLETWQPGQEIENKMTGQKFTPGSREEIEQLAVQTGQTYANTAKFAEQQILLQTAKMPDIYGSRMTPISSGDLDKVIAKAIEKQDEVFADLDPDTYKALREAGEVFKMYVEEGGEAFFKEVKDAAGNAIDKQVFGEVFQDMQKTGEIRGMSGGPGFTSMDITRPQLEAAVAQSNDLVAKLQKDFGYVPNVEESIIATSDEQISVQHADMKILQYILNQILDTNRKQLLQGIWNLPEGAEFWVPLHDILNQQADAAANKDGFGLKDPTLYPSPKDIPYSEIPGEELAMYGYKDLKELIDELKGPKADTTEYKLSDAYRPEGRGPFSDRVRGAEEVSSGKEEFSIGELLMRMLDSFQNRFTPSQSKDMSDVVASRGPMDKAGEAQSVQTKLDLKLTSTTQLIVDGRILASIVKPYLAGDLLKTNESSGTITKTYVI